MHTCPVAQLCLTLWDPMDCSPPGFTIHGILPVRTVEWLGISFFRGSSWPRDWTWVSCIGRWILYHWATWEAPHNMNFTPKENPEGRQMITGGLTREFQLAPAPGGQVGSRAAWKSAGTWHLWAQRLPFKPHGLPPDLSGTPQIFWRIIFWAYTSRRYLSLHRYVPIHLYHSADPPVSQWKGR